MNILFLSTVPEPWGGSEELWGKTAVLLKSRGHRVAAIPFAKELNHPRQKELWREGVEFPPFPLKSLSLWTSAYRRGLVPLLSQRPLFSLAWTLLGLKPDLAVISQGCNWDGAWIAEELFKNSIPYILLSHKATESSWPSDSLLPTIRLAHREALASLFVSTRTLELTQFQFSLSLPQGGVFRNPIRTDSLEPLAWPLGDEFRMASIGRFNLMEKGQDRLLCSLAGSRWRERRFHLSLYGDGIHKETLREMVARSGDPRITIEGFQGDLEEIWSKNHLLLLPSRSEGLPLTLLEAFWYGRPAVVTDVGGNYELVEEGKTGFLSPSAELFGEALERAWEARQSWPNLGEEAARRVRRFQPPHPERDLADLIERQAAL